LASNKQAHCNGQQNARIITLGHGQESNSLPVDLKQCSILQPDSEQHTSPL